MRACLYVFVSMFASFVYVFACVIKVYVYSDQIRLMIYFQHLYTYILSPELLELSFQELIKVKRDEKFLKTFYTKFDMSYIIISDT